MKKLVISIFSILLIACATQKNKTHPNPDFNEIKFGTVGGFAGTETQFLLNNRGEVYKISDDSTLVNQISNKEIEAIAEKIKSMDIQNMDVNDFGNMTYHLEITTADYSKKLSWADQTKADDAKELYGKLVKTLKK